MSPSWPCPQALRIDISEVFTTWLGDWQVPCQRQSSNRTSAPWLHPVSHLSPARHVILFSKACWQLLIPPGMAMPVLKHGSSWAHSLWLQPHQLNCHPGGQADPPSVRAGSLPFQVTAPKDWSREGAGIRVMLTLSQRREMGQSSSLSSTEETHPDSGAPAKLGALTGSNGGNQFWDEQSHYLIHWACRSWGNLCKVGEVGRERECFLWQQMQVNKMLGTGRRDKKLTFYGH